MTPDLEKIIPPMDEEGRALRIEAEHKLLNHVLKELDKDNLKPSEFRDLMRSYCELKRRDNDREKITVAAAMAQLRESARAATRNRPARRGSWSTDPAYPDSSFGGSADSSLSTGYPDEQSEHVEETDPDVDPEWSLAPWGRRKNGKPRTEKEYRTILYRTVRDVYGLDLTESTEKQRPNPIAHAHLTPDTPPSSTFPTSAIPLPKSDIDSSAIPHPTSDIHNPRSPPGVCGEPPFDPQPRNPWCYF